MLTSFSNKYVPALAYAGGLILIQVILLILFYWQLPPEVPLFFSLPTGSSQLADKQWLLLLPGLAIFIGLLHSLVYRLQNSDTLPMMRLIVLWSPGLFVTLSSISLIHVLWLVY